MSSYERVRELLDLTAVHHFYVGLLQRTLSHDVPIPHVVDHAATGDERARNSIGVLRRWLNVLDLAVVPPMVRDSLNESTKRETAEALLRYFVFRASPSNREKADFVVTFLFKQSASADQVTPLPPLEDPTADVPPIFEPELRNILADIEILVLPEEHRQLLREFNFIRQEIEEFRTFDQLMDSGIMQRVREIKQSFGESFFHPRVLATVAEYNGWFGRRFDELFRDAANQIKTFAAKVQQDGGSIASRVEGDVLVQHLADVEENSILQQEYGHAQEQFRKVSKYKKVVDKRHRPPTPVAAPPPAPTAAVEMRMAGSASSAAPLAAIPGVGAGIPSPEVPARAFSAAIEEGKVREVTDTIRNFVRAAGDPKTVSVVPLRNCRFPVNAVEVDCFRTDYLDEKSFRADFANTVCLVVALHARMMVELNDLTARQESAYLWKPHADSLTYLISAAAKTLEPAQIVAATASQRGMTDKAKGLTAAIQTLQGRMQQVAKTLESLGTSSR